MCKVDEFNEDFTKEVLTFINEFYHLKLKVRQPKKTRIYSLSSAHKKAFLFLDSLYNQSSIFLFRKFSIIMEFKICAMQLKMVIH